MEDPVNHKTHTIESNQIASKDKHYESEVTLTEQNLPLNYCQPPKMLIYFEERLTSFHSFNIGCVGQRDVRLLAIKVGGLKKRLLSGPS